MSTKDNLLAAFAGESQANRKYLAFAAKANADGYPQIAKLFRAAADAETVHAHAHLRVLGGVRSTTENLKEAIAGEGHEFKMMYPEFVAAAQAEGEKTAEVSFNNALAVERIHHGLYSNALTTLQGGSDLAGEPIFVCQVCGNTVGGEAPDNCPICGAPKKRFTDIQ